MKPLRHFWYAILLTSLLVACSDNKDVVRLIDQAESIMEQHPDSAYQLLSKADSTIAHQSRETRMRHLMLTTEAENKLYLPLPSDTLFQQVVDYYDKHGTPNQQLKAHYLLGCIYRDRGETPMTLLCYNDAVEKADTLSNDCDFNTLYKVYGQMADIYEAQVMPDEELEALRHYSNFAKKAGKIYDFIRGIEFMSSAYYVLGDTAMVLSVEEKAHTLYKNYNMPKAAASAYTTSMYVYIAKGNYTKVRQLMQIFEKESGLFDKEGNIVEDRAHYYHCKGLYYMGVGQLDSAEYQFKRLIPYGYTFDAYSGLLAVNQQKKDAPAVLAYNKLYKASFDTLVTNIHAQATRQALGMYDYSRHQRIAAQEAKKSEERQSIIYSLILGFMLIAAIIFQLYTKAKAKKQYEIRLLKQRLANISERFTRTKEELEMMETDLTLLKEQKEEELTALQQQLQEIQDNYGQHLDSYEGLVQSQFIVNLLKKLETKTTKPQPLTNKEWSLLINEFRCYMPRLYSYMTDSQLLGEREFHATILTRLGIKTDDIALLLDTTKQNASNAKAAANKKLFSDNSARSFFRNLSRY